MIQDIPMKRLGLLSTSLLLLSLACGGGGGTPDGGTHTTAATGLAYTDPAGTGWRLVKDPSSTAQHLVLDLVGPSAGSGYGVGFTLSVDQTKAAWSKVLPADAEYVKNGAYNLGTGSQFLKGKVQGNALMAGVFQKGVGGAAVTYGTAPLVKVALDFVPGSAPGTPITITVSSSQELTAGGMSNVTVATGTLVTQ